MFVRRQQKNFQGYDFWIFGDFIASSHFSSYIFIKGIVMFLYQRKSPKNLFRASNLSGKKLYRDVVISWKKLLESIKYWKSWWCSFCTPLKFNKSHLIFLLKIWSFYLILLGVINMIFLYYVYFNSSL